MINLTIDGNKITVDDGTTVLDAARRVGIEIPALCSRPLNPPQGDLKNGEMIFDHLHFQSPPAGDLGGERLGGAIPGGAVSTETSPPGPLSHRRGGVGEEQIEPPVSCFVCAVKIVGRSGFVPSCVALAEEGMVVESTSEAVYKSRRQALELLLGHHNGDCEAPCSRICPCSIDIPEMIRAIMTGDSAGMISAVHAAMPFPAVLGYICSAPCENGCRRKQVDSAVSIRELHKFAALAAMGKDMSRLVPTRLPPTGKKVAIVGAGLAGLTAAYHLSCFGHECMVIERNSRPGGPLVNEPDGQKLPANILDYEIDQIRKCGVTFQFDTEVNSLKELKGTFDAIIIACGTNLEHWIGQQGITCSKRGIDVQNGTFATSVDGVFAIGGAIIPGKSASRTVGQSTTAAYAIHRILTLRLPNTRPLNPTSAGVPKGLPQGDLNTKETHAPSYNTNQSPAETGMDRSRPVPSFDSFMGKLSPDDLKRFAESIPSINRYGQVATCPSSPEQQAIPAAESEMATRCLQCDCGKKTVCDLRRYAAEYGARQNSYKLDKPLKSERQIFKSGLVYEPGKCILCGRCVGITKLRSLITRPLNPTSAGVPKGLPQGDLKTTDQTSHSCLQSPPAGDLGGALSKRGEEFGGTGLTFINRGSDLYVDTPFGEPMDEAMGDCMDQCIDACPTGALWKVI